jgi:hypothetical protein
METARQEKESEMADIIYACSVCGRQTTVKEGQPVPLCCKKEMEPLPFCTSAPNPEMVRNNDEDLPCNDGTQPHPPPGRNTGVNPGDGEPGAKK